jgi:capsular polysaccharide transport system ATP-binding protein
MIKSAVFSVSGPGVVIENGREHDFDDIEDAIALHLENMERLGK